MIDISIIIPTYNRLWCLEKAIQSCRNSSCNVEIIVIDDGSIDGTFAWLKNQSDIVTIFQENLGKCYAVNRGMSIAAGKYVRFLDSDDYLSNEAIKEQFDIAEKEKADIVVSGYVLIDENENILRSEPWQCCDDFVAQLLGEADSSHYSAYLFKRDFILDIPHRPDFKFRDDRLFVLEAALKNPKLAVHNSCSLFHKTHRQQRLQNTTGIDQVVQNYQHLNLYKKILVQLEAAGKLSPRRINAAVKILWPLARWIAIYDIDEANNVVKWIFELKPDFTYPDGGFATRLYNALGFKTTEYIAKLRRLILNK